MLKARGKSDSATLTAAAITRNTEKALLYGLNKYPTNLFKRVTSIEDSSVKL